MFTSRDLRITWILRAPVNFPFFLHPFATLFGFHKAHKAVSADIGDMSMEVLVKLPFSTSTQYTARNDFINVLDFVFLRETSSLSTVSYFEEGTYLNNNCGENEGFSVNFKLFMNILPIFMENDEDIILSIEMRYSISPQSVASEKETLCVWKYAEKEKESGEWKVRGCEFSEGECFCAFEKLKLKPLFFSMVTIDRCDDIMINPPSSLSPLVPRKVIKVGGIEIEVKRKKSKNSMELWFGILYIFLFGVFSLYSLGKLGELLIIDVKKGKISFFILVLLSFQSILSFTMAFQMVLLNYDEKLEFAANAFLIFIPFFNFWTIFSVIIFSYFKLLGRSLPWFVEAEFYGKKEKQKSESWILAFSQAMIAMKTRKGRKPLKFALITLNIFVGLATFTEMFLFLGGQFLRAPV